MSEALFNPSVPPDQSIGTLLIHGVGLIGGSIGMAARRREIVGEVVGVGRDADRLETAFSLGAIDRFIVAGADGFELHRACSEADVIVLCTPVSRIIHDLPRFLSMAGKHAVVTDVGSVKGAIVAAAGSDTRYVGSHPMAGSELAGIEAARPGLFDGATWALTPTDATGKHAYDTIRALAENIGAVTRTLSPDLHDSAVAVTSHLPHVIAYALTALAADMAASNPGLPDLAAGSFAGATRVAASQPGLWRDIASANRPALIQALRTFRRRLDAMQDALDSNDSALLESLFHAGYQAKRNWPPR